MRIGVVDADIILKSSMRNSGVMVLSLMNLSVVVAVEVSIVDNIVALLTEFVLVIHPMDSVQVLVMETMLFFFMGLSTWHTSITNGSLLSMKLSLMFILTRVVVVVLSSDLKLSLSLGQVGALASFELVQGSLCVSFLSRVSDLRDDRFSSGNVEVVVVSFVL